MDIVIGRHSFNAYTLKTISKEKALKSFKSIDKNSGKGMGGGKPQKGKKKTA